MPQEFEVAVEQIVDSFNDDLVPPTESVEQSEPVEDTTETVEEPASEEVTESTEESADESAEATEKPDTYLLKHFNGDEEVSREEVIKRAQKGMDYDRVKAQLTELRDDPRLKAGDALNELADSYGYKNADEFLNKLFEAHDKQIAEEQGVSPESIKREREATRKEKAANKVLEDNSKKQQQDAQYKAFLDKYPTVNASDIKPETYARVEAGKTLIEAYEAQLKADAQQATDSRIADMEAKLNALQAENEALKKADKVKRSNPVGSLEGKADPEMDSEMAQAMAIWDD